jgi:O-antigen/teichoic acid export membrane protein
MTVIRNISYFLFAVILSRAMGFFQSYLVARALGPKDFGIWATLLLVVSYAPILCLGTLESLLKQVPYYLGRNDLPRTHEIESTVLGSLVLSAVLVVVLALLTPLVLPFTSFNVEVWLTIMVLATIAINYFSSFFYLRFSAYENFKMTGAMDAVRAACAFVFVGGLGWVWGLRGVAVGYLLHEIAMFVIISGLNISQHGRPGISFRKESILQAIRVGLPISLLWWVLTLTASLDRLVLGGMLGATVVGYYAFGISLAGMLFLVPTVVGRVLYPRVNKHVGANANVESMKRVVLAPTLALGTLLINTQIGLLICVPFIYNVLLPKYRPGLFAGQILILGLYGYCLFRNAANYLIAANQERLFLKFIVITLVFNFVFDVSLVKVGFGMAGVAAGTSLAGFFLNTIVWRRVLIGLGFDRRQQWRAMLELYLPLLAAVVVLGAMGLSLRTLRLFQSFDIRSIALGILALVLVNGLLWSIPMYRTEAATWIKKIRRNRQPATGASLSDLAVK